MRPQLGRCNGHPAGGLDEAAWLPAGKLYKGLHTSTDPKRACAICLHLGYGFTNWNCRHAAGSHWHGSAKRLETSVLQADIECTTIGELPPRHCSLTLKGVRLQDMWA